MTQYYSYVFPFGGLYALGTFELMWLLAWFVLAVLPFILILRKAGFSPLWLVLCIVPPLAYIFLWVFALSRWPVEDRAGRPT